MKQEAQPNHLHYILKDATRRQIKAAGGLEAAADQCRVGRTELSNYQSNHVSRFMPVDVLAQLMEETRSTELLEALASIVDRAIVPPEESGNDLTGDIASLAEHAAKLFGHFARECGKPNQSLETLAALDADLATIVRIGMHARSVIRRRMAGAGNARS